LENICLICHICEAQVPLTAGLLASLPFYGSSKQQRRI
jgi:hypothetical protein